jgi:hypothetical protein
MRALNPESGAEEMTGVLMRMLVLLLVLAAAGSRVVAEANDGLAPTEASLEWATSAVRTLDDDQLRELRGSNTPSTRWKRKYGGLCITPGCRWITNSYWWIYGVMVNELCEHSEIGYQNCGTCPEVCCYKIYCDGHSDCDMEKCADETVDCTSTHTKVHLWNNPPPPECIAAYWAEGTGTV